MTGEMTHGPTIDPEPDVRHATERLCRIRYKMARKVWLWALMLRHNR